MVEHRLAKARVASSSLVSRSNLRSEGKSKKVKGKGKGSFRSFAFFLLPFAFKVLPFSFILTDGGVAKW